MLSPASDEPTPLQKIAIDIMGYTTGVLGIELSDAELDDMNPVRRKRQALADAYGAAVGFAVAHDLPLPHPPEALLDQRDHRRVAARAVRPLARAAQILNFRRLIRPLFVLGFRAGLVFWFLRPFRRPYIPLLLLAWIAWELYTIIFENVVRHVAGQARANAQIARQRQEALNAAAGAVGGQQGGRPAGAAAQPVGQQAGVAGDLQAVPPAENVAPPNVFQRFARIFFEREARAIFGVPNPDGTVRYATLPLRHRIWSFMVLLIATVNPNFYELRRKAVEDRERDIRVRFGRMAEEGEEPVQPRIAGEEPPPLPPTPPTGWVGMYVTRARRGIS